MDIRVPRNGDYFEDWQLHDSDDNPIDISDDTLELKIRAVAGQGSALASAVIDKHDPTNGIFSVRISGASLLAVSGQSEVARLAYDLRQTFPDGIQFIPVEGQILLTPGATY
jgi:hypothetical protein